MHWVYWAQSVQKMFLDAIKYGSSNSLDSFAPWSDFNDRAYICEVAPCLRQASLQLVIAQVHKGQLHHHACVIKGTSSGSSMYLKGRA